MTALAQSPAFKLHYASILEGEAAKRCGSTFAAILLRGAERARSEAQADREPQGDLFGGMA